MSAETEHHKHHNPASKPASGGIGHMMERASRVVTEWSGSSWAFGLAAAIVLVWLCTGPVFHYSDTWQLVINTGTTIVTFLMVFLIQNSQNRDALAFQVKLDELIIKLHGAGNEIAGAEDLCDEDLEALHEAYKKRAAHAHETLEKRRAAR